MHPKVNTLAVLYDANIVQQRPKLRTVMETVVPGKHGTEDPYSDILSQECMQVVEFLYPAESVAGTFEES
jgi:hypothetical protein